MFIVHWIVGLLADKIVTHTKDYADYSYYLKYFKHKTVFIYSPIKLTESNVEIPVSKAKHKIGFVGRMAKQKGLPHLLQAIPIIESKLGNDFKVILAGPYKEVIGENYKDEIQDLLDKHSDHLQLLGPIENADISQFYKAIDVFVLPSDDTLECFPLVQIESMLAGTPVVSTDLPGVRVGIQKTNMGLSARVGDSSDLAMKIAEVLTNKKKYLKNKGKIKDIFDYDESISQYIKVFSKN